MKRMLKSLSVLTLGLLTVCGPLGTAFAEDAPSQDNIGQIVDVTTTAGGNVKDCAESLADFLADTTDDQALDLVVGALKKAGLDGGWAKQIGGLRKFAGIAGKLLDAITIGDTVRKLENVWNDRAAFSEVFADQMTEYAANAVAGFVSAAIKTYGTGVIAGGTVVAPGLGTIIATGGVWLISWGVGELAGWAFEKLAGTDLIQNGMVALGGAIWDYFHKSDAEDPDPFDSSPSSDRDGQKNDGKANRFKGLKPLRLVD